MANINRLAEMKKLIAAGRWVRHKVKRLPLEINNLQEPFGH
jgi:hypothetical protein